MVIETMHYHTSVARGQVVPSFIIIYIHSHRTNVEHRKHEVSLAKAPSNLRMFSDVMQQIAAPSQQSLTSRSQIWG